VLVGKGSADGDGGVQNGIVGRKSRPMSGDGDRGAHIQRSCPSMLSSAHRGGRQRVWNEMEMFLIEVEQGIEERPS
jgi:hypothetical protein